MIDIPDFVYEKIGGRPPAETQAQKRAKVVPKITLDKSGRKGKMVTVITGLPVDHRYLKDSSRELKIRTGSGGTYFVSDGQGVIEIQGDHREVIAELFRCQL
jgi:predicted translation initiation factor SUI1